MDQFMNIVREHPDEKLILGLSLGSSNRDHVTSVEILGKRMRLFRKGTDGDFRRLVAAYREYDGRVDAFGLGGATFYVTCGKDRQGRDRKYYFRQSLQVLQTVRRTPIGDGSLVKELLERQAIEAVERQGVQLRGARTVVVSAVDRMGLARALVEHGCRTMFGDVIFSLGLPVPLHSLGAVERLGRVVLPVFTKVPISLLYPTGERQDRAPSRRHQRYLEDADIIAGDYNYVRMYLPDRLHGKVIITNTTTAADVEMLRARGLRLLVTGTPRMNGRSFGTNVMEAMLLAMVGKRHDEVSQEEIRSLVDEIPLRPSVERLND